MTINDEAASYSRSARDSLYHPELTSRENVYSNGTTRSGDCLSRWPSYRRALDDRTERTR